MITVAVIAILAGIAYPSYQGYLRRNACETAKASLAGLANAMERFRAQRGTYLGAANADDEPTIYPIQSPQQGAAQFTLSIDPDNTTATFYRIVATPVAGGLLANRGTLILLSTGERDGTGDLDGTQAGSWGECREL
ncbi:Type IV minor pilin ComP, DNA uptake sequence receptor [compost metagenome]